MLLLLAAVLVLPVDDVVVLVDEAVVLLLDDVAEACVGTLLLVVEATLDDGATGCAEVESAA